MNLRVCDLFSGIGGATLAFTRTGFKSVFASEIDPQAADTYEANHGHLPAGDIAGLDLDAVPDHDVAFIGLPCVGFSTLGLRRGFDDPREAVWYSALKLVARKKPQVVVVENVAGLVRNHGGVALRFVRGCLRAVGYRTSWGILDATRFGGAQHRRRVFVVASRQGRFDFGLLPVGTTGRIRDILAPQPTDQYLDPSAYRLLARPRPCRTGPVFAGHRTGRLLWRPGGDPDEPRTHRQLHRIYSPDGTSPTVTAHGPGQQLWVSTDRGVRRLNGREWVGLMGYPADFRWPHPEVIRRLLGNGVHVPTVEALARQIREQLFCSEPRATKGVLR